MDNWIFQGVITSVLATVLWFGGATMLTWVKHKWPRYGDLALYWIASAACLAILWFAVTGYIPFSKRQLQVTPENIETNLKLWSEHFGLAFTVFPAPDSAFGYTVVTRTGTPIQVTRLLKDKPDYLQFSSQFTMSPEHQAAMNTLTNDQVETVVQEIALELAKTRVGFSMATLGVPQTGTAAASQTLLVFQKAAPINNLNEYAFSQDIDDMEFTVSLARAATSLALKRATASRTVNRTPTVTQSK